MRSALRTLAEAAQALANVIIWGVFFLLPLVLIALIPIAIAIWFLRWLFRRMSKRKPQPAVAKTEQT